MLYSISEHIKQGYHKLTIGISFFIFLLTKIHFPLMLMLMLMLISILIFMIIFVFSVADNWSVSGSFDALSGVLRWRLFGFAFKINRERAGARVSIAIAIWTSSWMLLIVASTYSEASFQLNWSSLILTLNYHQIFKHYSEKDPIFYKSICRIPKFQLLFLNIEGQPPIFDNYTYWISFIYQRWYSFPPSPRHEQAHVHLVTLH